MSYDLAELLRRIENLIALGTVHEVDYSSAKARVKVGSIITTWLPWVVSRASNNTDWNAPEEGEQVVLLSPSGNYSNGVILPAIYQNAHPANADTGDVTRTDFKDGAFVEYNRETHTYTVSIPGDSATVNLTAATINIIGNVNIQGEVIQSGGDLSSNGVVLDKHKHGGVMSGGSLTSNPQ